MTRRIAGLAALTIVGALAGCLPDKYIIWSPDGQRAALIANDRGLYFCGPDGKLTPRLAEGVGHVIWRPDSRGLVLVRMVALRTWDEVVAMLDPELVKRLTVVGDELRAELLAYEGNWDSFDPRCKAKVGEAEFGTLILYLRDRHSEGLAEKLGERWKDVQDAEVTSYRLQVAEVGDSGLTLGKVLSTSLGGISEPRVSPDGRLVTFLRVAPMPADTAAAPAGDLDRTWAYVAPLDGSAPPRPLTRTFSMSPDWSADGQYVVCSAASHPLLDNKDALQLGVVARQRVCGERGQLLAEFSESESLAGILFSSEQPTRVRCLPDGRVIFATIEVTLPSTAEDMPQRVSLFAVDPGRQPTLIRLVPRQAEPALPDAGFLFEPSPDGRRVCLPDSNGRVAVLTLADGHLWEVLGPADVDKLRMQPVWRSDDELCFMIKLGPPDNQRRQIALAALDWDANEIRRTELSTDWPPEVVANLLIDQPASDLATSQPAAP